jgi:hypothetical protein
MADNINTKNLSALLSKPEEWNDWDHEFLLQAESYGLSAHINHRENLLPRPQKPDIRLRKYTKTVAAARGATSQTIGGSADEIDEAEVIQEKRNGQWLLSDLTDAGLKTYNLDLQGYKQLEPDYKEEQSAVQKLRKWIMQTVAPPYKSTCCNAGEPLWKWHNNLQKRCGQSKADELLETRTAYKNSLKPPRNPRDALMWVDKWETAMAKATQQGVAETKQTIAWVPDLLQALQGIMPIWATTFRQTREQEIADGSITFRSVGNLIRKELQALSSQNKTARASKGAWVTTYDGLKGHDSDEDAQSVDEKKPRRKGLKESRGSNAGQKRSRSRAEGSTDMCAVCDRPHALANCYYVFPEKAWSGFRKSRVTEEKVQEALANNADLQAQVRALKGPRSKSKSRTPKPTKEEVVEEVED